MGSMKYTFCCAYKMNVMLAAVVVIILNFLVLLQECKASTVAGRGQDDIVISNRKLLQSVAGLPPPTKIVVDLNGYGSFRSVQAAVDSIPVGNPQKVVIQINPGNYLEKVIVPNTLPYLTFQGAGSLLTSITWQDIASNIGLDGKELTSYNSASVMVFADHFTARDIAFKNAALPPPPGTEGRQGAAFRISGDMAAFYNCAFYGAQDTLCDDSGRHYFKSCYIEGSIAFIFGTGQSIYMLVYVSNQASTLRSFAAGYGSIAAHDRESRTDPSGFSFVGCQLLGTGYNYLGRAMGHYSRIIYSECYMEDMIAPQVWDDWNHDTTRDSTVTYGMYQCWGPGVNQTVHRVPWAHDFNQLEAMQYTHLDFINGQEWLAEV